MRHFPSAALALLMIPVSLAAAETRQKWPFAPFSFIQRTRAEKHAPPNDQPLRVDAAALGAALGSLRFTSASTDEPLFAPEEAREVAVALAEALATAGPGEDLELQSTRRRGQNRFSNGLGVVARVFAQGGRINVIVQEPRLDWVVDFIINDRTPDFDFGSRTRSGPVLLKAPGSELRRPDWVVLNLLAVPAATPKAVDAPSGGVEERLRTLKHLREQNLINDEDYAKGKDEIIKSLSK